MKKGAGFSSIISNRFAYSIITFLMVLLIGVSVYAFGTQNPGTFGHSAKELDLSSGIEGNAVFNGNVQATGTVTGSNLKSQCSAGQIVKGFDANGNIVCIEDAGGGGSYTGNLVNSAHTGSNCMTSNGIVEPINGTGIYVCKFPQGACPSGWTKYREWSSTSGNTCVSGGCQTDSCTTGNHPFMDKEKETCTYTTYYTESGDSPNCLPQSGGSCTASIIEVGCY